MRVGSMGTHAFCTIQASSAADITVYLEGLGRLVGAFIVVRTGGIVWLTRIIRIIHNV